MAAITTPTFANPQTKPAGATDYPLYADNGNEIYINGQACAVLKAPINLAVASTPQTVVTGVAGQKIRLLSAYWTNTTAGGSGAFNTSTSHASMVGPMIAAANQTVSLPFNKFGYGDTGTGDNLEFASVGSSNQSGGVVQYCFFTP
jgi:hypothetical protein